MRRLSSVAIFIGALCFALPTLAQQPPPTRIRGTIETVDLPMLTVKSSSGETQKVRIADNARVSAMVKASVDDLKPNVFVGVTGVPDANGGEKAYEVHIFPEERRGTGEGRNNWDRGPKSMMTNGALTLQKPAPGTKVQIEGASGQMLTVNYKGQEAKIALAPDTIIAAYAPGSDKSELKPGTNVTVVTSKRDDGSLEASAVIYGRDGFTPPI
ncbi:MAG: hypothetical protein JOZ16_02730 [Methylobacteriaceae bacterium]|nr:hypothetical protein [Methylobacteriaceae bacterium]